MNTFNTARVSTAATYGVTFTPEMTPELAEIQACDAYKTVITHTANMMAHFDEPELAQIILTAPAYSRSPMTIRQMALSMLFGAISTEQALGVPGEVTEVVGEAMYDVVLEMNQVPATERDLLKGYFEGLREPMRAYLLETNLVQELNIACAPMKEKLVAGMVENCQDVIEAIDKVTNPLIVSGDSTKH